jgi:hypothetical protein
MTTTWTTKSGKQIEINLTRKDGTRLVGIDSMTIDGKQVNNPTIRPEGVQFFMGSQKFVTPLPENVADEIEALRNEDKVTEAQLWAQEQGEKYEASVRKIGNAMNK